MTGDEVLVAEDSDAGDGVHVLRMEEVDELGQIGDVVALTGGQSNVDDTVAILDIEDYGVAADFAPVADNALAVFAASHDSGEINGADFEIACNWDRFLYNWRFENSGDDDLLSGFQEDPLTVVIGIADGFGQIGRGEVFRALQIFAGDGGDAVSALGDVDVGTGRGDQRFGGLCLLIRSLISSRGVGFHLYQLLSVGILYGGYGWRQ